MLTKLSIIAFLVVTAAFAVAARQDHHCTITSYVETRTGAEVKERQVPVATTWSPTSELASAPHRGRRCMSLRSNKSLLTTENISCKSHLYL